MKNEKQFKFLLEVIYYIVSDLVSVLLLVLSSCIAIRKLFRKNVACRKEPCKGLLQLCSQFLHEINNSFICSVVESFFCLKFVGKITFKSKIIFVLKS